MKALALAALLALPAAAKPLKTPDKLAGENGRIHFRIAFKMKLKELDRSGNFVVLDGSQANYVDGGETAVPGTGSGAEYKKRSLIVNCVAVQDPRDAQRVKAECQFELSGPVHSADGKTYEAATFQLQDGFEVVKGKPLVLVDEADKHLELVVTQVE